jgi:F-type H+-transporting ATPase subunit a
MADAYSPLHQFVIQPIIPLHVAGIDISFTNSSLWMMIATMTAIVVFGAATAPRAIVPGRLQAMAEGTYRFIANMVRDNTGLGGMQYFPFVFTIFMVVFLGNALGLIPHSFTYTSHIVVTAALAMMIFIMVTVIGLVKHGSHFFQLFLPPGVPLWLAPIIIPIELISFLVRPVTLSVRLFANMMAGHIMLKVFAGLSVAAMGMGTAGVVVGLMPALFNTVLIGFELLIAFLQAYVFTILTCIYLKDTVEIAH